MGGLLESLSSYDTNIMLAAIIFLLLVILFVVLLHIYAKWFLSRSGRLRRAPPPPVNRLVMVPSFRALPYTSATSTSTSSKGVEASAIASIPMFVYSKQAHARDEECVICLSGFQDGEAGRRLAGCSHAFHVACIDTWLRSHTTCPVCRKEHDAVGAAEEEAAAAVVVVVVSMQSQPQPGGDTNASSLPTSSASILSVPSSISSSSNNDNSSSSASSLGGSLKRILSRNRSESSKVFPSNVNVNAAVGQLDV